MPLTCMDQTQRRSGELEADSPLHGMDRSSAERRTADRPGRPRRRRRPSSVFLASTYGMVVRRMRGTASRRVEAGLYGSRSRGGPYMGRIEIACAGEPRSSVAQATRLEWPLTD